MLSKSLEHRLWIKIIIEHNHSNFFDFQCHEVRVKRISPILKFGVSVVGQVKSRGKIM